MTRTLTAGMFLTTVLLAFAPVVGLAQSGDVAKASLADFSFLAGQWRGRLGSRVIEEHWSAPEGNSLMGMFRIVRGSKTVMYEINAIEQTDRGPVLTIRHYGAGLAEREETAESTTFTLVGLTKDKATFAALDKHARLSYARTSATELVIALDKPAPDGKRSMVEFRFIRAAV